MPAPRILIVFGTKFGHTAKVARHIGEQLVDVGCDVTLTTRGALPTPADMAGYDGVIVGAGVIGGRHARWVEEFVGHAAGALNRMPSAFFSVCMNAASPKPGVRQEAEKYIETFLAATTWTPHRAISVGGALAYRRYNFLLRFIMKRIAARGGFATDTARNHEYTDWWKLEGWVRGFLAELRGAELVEREGALTE